MKPRLDEKRLRELVRRLLREVEANAATGGVHTFHGNQWPPEKVGLPGPRFDDGVPVTDHDLDAAEDWLETYEPDEIVAYSRGSAVLNKLAAERPDIKLPKVTYVAPAAKRDAWGAKNIDAPGVSGRVIASAGDGAVPVKQACDIADEAGVPMYVVPGEFKSDDWSKEGQKNHIRVLKYKNDSSPGVAIEPGSCASDPELPNWGTGLADERTLKRQISTLAKVLKVDFEDLAGRPMEGSSDHYHEAKMGKLYEAVYGKGERRKRARKLDARSLRQLILREARLVMEDADPSKFDFERFPLKLSDAAADQKAARHNATSGNRDGSSEDDVIKADSVTLPVKSLKPSQTSMDVKKAVAFAICAILEVTPFENGPGGDLGAIISNDKHIMDGHHRWIATAMIDPTASVTGQGVNFPAEELIAALNAITVKVGVLQGKEGSGGFENFTKEKFEALLKDYAENGFGGGRVSGDQVKQALKTFTGGKEGDEAVAEAAAKMAANVGQVTTSVPSGFPDRVDMPVISAKKGHLKVAIDWLKKGKVNVNPPYDDEEATDETQRTDESYDLTRWAKLAGLLVG